MPSRRPPSSASRGRPGRGGAADGAGPGGGPFRGNRCPARPARSPAGGGSQRPSGRPPRRAAGAQRRGRAGRGGAPPFRGSPGQRRGGRGGSRARAPAQRRPEDVAVAEAQIWAAQARLRVAQADLALSRLYAPIAGTVLSIHARPGDRIGEDGLLELADLRRMEVVADVYETDLPRLRLGQPAEIIVPGEAQRLSALLTEIGWQVRRTVQAGTDPVAAVDARTVSVRLRLDEAGAALLRRRSNMQVQVAIRP
ncbi:efflux RND transporter periplasmic adaptor subunit [Teichococcus aestuarii]|uniref:efflux RND transporter periplasmic adaptor subunit n=1 Tax=Teichococcus aestuarii TaxID=568898 RepID=UPI00361460ED